MKLIMITTFILLQLLSGVLSSEIGSLGKQGEHAASWYDSYHNLDDIYAYYKTFATTYPALVNFTSSIGVSVEGRSIAAITVGASSAKWKIFLLGGQSAREWITHSTATYITEQLLTDPTAKDLLESFQFVIVPVANPDGYVYTWGSDRLWRKNRRQNEDGSFGVCLARNWDDHWDGTNSDPNPSSDNYMGIAPFSEPETRAVSTFFQKNRPFAAAIDFHSYGQRIARPYGWTSALPPNDAAAKAAGDGMSAAISATLGSWYASEPTYLTPGILTGIASDWFQSAGEVTLSYTIKLRDDGTYGYELPASEIIPTGKEIWAAVHYLANSILQSKN